MARNNYQFEKRQKDIAKKKKQDEKRQKKLNKRSVDTENTPGSIAENTNVDEVVKGTPQSSNGGGGQGEA